MHLENLAPLLLWYCKVRTYLTMTCMKACLGWNHCSSRIPRGMAAIRYRWSENGLRAGREGWRRGEGWGREGGGGRERGERGERREEREGGRDGGREKGGQGWRKGGMGGRREGRREGGREGGRGGEVEDREGRGSRREGGGSEPTALCVLDTKLSTFVRANHNRARDAVQLAEFESPTVFLYMYMYMYVHVHGTTELKYPCTKMLMDTYIIIVHVHAPVHFVRKYTNTCTCTWGVHCTCIL